MSSTLSGFAYLIASVLFILALRGLSSPETARRGNTFGIAGMVIAVATTISDPSIVSLEFIIMGILVGGSIGTIVARKIDMTGLPQLVAAFHSLVGLAAVFVAAAAFYSPEAYGIGKVGNIHTASVIEMSLGLSIGAITFSGSVIAFAKLQGIMSGNPITFPMQHPVNAGPKHLLDHPVIRPHHLLINATNRQHRNDGRSPVATLGWPTVNQPLHEPAKLVHIEGAVLHVVGNVVSPSLSQLLAFLVAAFIDLRVVRWLSCLKKFNDFIHALGTVRVTRLLRRERRDNHKQRNGNKCQFPHDVFPSTA